MGRYNIKWSDSLRYDPLTWLTVRLDSKFSEQTNTCEFRKAVNFAYSQGGLKLEINIPPQHISAKSKGGLIIEGGIISSEYGNSRAQWKNRVRPPIASMITGQKVCHCVAGFEAEISASKPCCSHC